MTTPKTFGQIAWDVDANQWSIPWAKATDKEREYWTRIGAAVALECSRICTEIAAEHMRKALEGEGGHCEGAMQRAALKCAEAIREAISCSSKEAP